MQHADKIVAPLLVCLPPSPYCLHIIQICMGTHVLVQLLQGDEDRVVPKSQSDMIYESIKRRGGVVEYQVYPGEGHGFRKAEHVKDATERELAFYRRILNIGADDAE